MLVHLLKQETTYEFLQLPFYTRRKKNATRHLVYCYVLAQQNINKNVIREFFALILKRLPRLNSYLSQLSYRENINCINVAR